MIFALQPVINLYELYLAYFKKVKRKLPALVGNLHHFKSIFKTPLWFPVIKRRWLKAFLKAGRVYRSDIKPTRKIIMPT